MDQLKIGRFIAAERKRQGLTQRQLAEQLSISDKTISKWECGETVPNTETLKLLSKLFDVSINTLLGSPHSLVCQCCGMPLEDQVMSREADGSLNEEYCQWCYADGQFVYTSLEQLIDFLVEHMSNEHWPKDQMRAYLQGMLPTLQYWKAIAQENLEKEK